MPLLENYINCISKFETEYVFFFHSNFDKIQCNAHDAEQLSKFY